MRTLLQPFLGDDLIQVSHPSSILRIVWIRNLGPIAVAAILVGVAVIVTLLTLFLLFKTAPEAAGQVTSLLTVLVTVGALAFGFSQRKR